MRNVLLESTPLATLPLGNSYGLRYGSVAVATRFTVAPMLITVQCCIRASKAYLYTVAPVADARRPRPPAAAAIYKVLGLFEALEIFAMLEPSSYILDVT